MTHDLGQQSMRSLRWSYGATAATLVLQLIGTTVLARLIAPDSYGVVAVAAGMVVFLSYLADLGVTSVVARERDLTPEDVWALALAALCLNLVIVVALWFAAPRIAAAFSLSSEAIPVLRAMALLVPLGGLSAAASAWLRRDLEFRKLGLFSLAGLVVGQGLVALPLALMTAGTGAGVWALVAGSIAQNATPVVLAMWQNPARLPPRSRWPRILGMLRLGANFSLLRLLDATQFQLAPLAIAFCAGTTAAGLYDRAFVLSVVLFEMASGALGRVLIPIYGRLGERGGEGVARLFAAGLRLALCLLGPVAVGMAVAAQSVVMVVLGPQWQGAVEPLQFLCCLALLRTLSMLSGGLIETHGKLGLHMAQRSLSIVGLLWWLGLVRPDSIGGVLMAIVAAEAFSAFSLLILALRSLGQPLIRGLAPLGLALSVSLPVGVVVAICSTLSLPPVQALLVEVVVGALTLAAVLSLHPSQALRREIRAFLRYGSVGEL